MLIVDAQVHIWQADTPERPWSAGAKPHREIPFTMCDLLGEMNAAGVHRAVLVPPSVDGVRNDLVLAAAHEHPDRFRVVGRLDLDRSSARERLESWREQPGML